VGALFVLIGYDGPDGAARRVDVRPEHLATIEPLARAGKAGMDRWEEFLEWQPLARAGKAVLAGPFTDGSGSLIEAALEIARSDPYVRHGVFNRYEVKPFKRVFP
jgi:hypothetical protein